MPDPGLPQSPLTKVLSACRRPGQSANPGVRLAERSWGYLSLRANEALPFRELLVGLSGLQLPIQPNTFAENSQAIAMWLGPDEWLLVVPLGMEHSVAQTLSQAGRDHFIAVTDVSHGNTTVNISGPRAIDTLSKGCSLDLHPSAFRNSYCAQTLLAKTGVVIRRVDDLQSFDLIVRRSFAEYLVLWLQDAGAEYGIEVL